MHFTSVDVVFHWGLQIFSNRGGLCRMVKEGCFRMEKINTDYNQYLSSQGCSGKMREMLKVIISRKHCGWLLAI